MNTPTARVALAYATRGLFVCPIKPGSKAPVLCKDWPGEWRARSGDPGACTEWVRQEWGRNPGANVALPPPPGFIVVDVDLYKPEGKAALDAYEAAHAPLSSPWAATTGRGGRHFVFRLPEGFDPATSQGTRWPGVDVRMGGKGYIIVAPSLVDGAGYAWDGADPNIPPTAVEPADLPPGFWEWYSAGPEPRPAPPDPHPAAVPARPPPAPGDALRTDWQERARKWAAKMLEGAATDLANAPDGAGNETAARVAYKVGGYVGAGHLEESEALAALEGAVSGWSWRASGDHATMSRTIRTQLQLGRARPIDPPIDAAPKPKATRTAPRADPTDEQTLDDNGNSQRFVADHADDLRFCWPRGQWYAWDGRRWAHGDAEAQERAKATARGLYAAAARKGQSGDPGAWAKWARHAAASNSRRGISGMADLAKSDPAMTVSPEAFDSNDWALNVENGTIDLRTGILREHRREDLHTRALATAYDPAATCPVWEAFLARIFANDAEMIRFVHRAIGYSLTGVTREHCLFLCYGGGANGKSTLLETIGSLLGSYARTTSIDTILDSGARQGSAPSPELIDLRGARLVTITEGAEGRRLAEGRIKALTGGDTISARGLHSAQESFKPVFKLWLATNHKPHARGQDEGLWRRMRLIPFGVTIPKEEQDKTLWEKLQSELQGILSWAVRGCLEWQRDGLQEPRAVVSATAEYRRAEDPLADFFDDAVDVDPNAQPLPAKALHKAYLEWCKEAEEDPLDKNAFGRRMTERGHSSVKRGGGSKYLGLRLRGTPADRTLPIGGEVGRHLHPVPPPSPEPDDPAPADFWNRLPRPPAPEPVPAPEPKPPPAPLPPADHCLHLDPEARADPAWPDTATGRKWAEWASRAKLSPDVDEIPLAAYPNGRKWWPGHAATLSKENPLPSGRPAVTVGPPRAQANAKANAQAGP